MANILLVDDEIITIKAIQENVGWERCGIGKVYLANTAATAKEIMMGARIDLVVSDIEMPGENGLMLAKWLQQKYPQIPVILLTAHARFGYAREAITLGVTEYLLKPIVYSDFEQKVVAVLQGKGRGAATGQPTGQLPPDVTELEPLDTQTIIEKVKAYVEENLDQELPRQEIAAHVALNESYLSRLFKKETGLSISEYILNKRMAKAKALLIQTSMSVSNIAMEVGYAYPAYFIKMFKREVGKTPKEYRADLRI